ncbi:hypothetical protein PsYK624_024940 [Phanerochaete sordida]|uniref:DUF6534 domain-containing protein n=1 Tax=Phanerochaete sordida TaxID=48140 RepID=A0A9P3G201_9APHY|nr:hypothetical protein PsYK624_024940 [Phanerochaete sordida]
MNYTTATDVSVAAQVAPQLFGTLFNLTFYGILAAQVAWCTTTFPDDRAAIKIIIYSVFALETLQTALVTYDAYRYFAAGFGDVDQLNRAMFEWFAVPVITGLVSCISQLYFAYRLYRFSNSIVSAISTGILSLAQMACAIAEGVRFYMLDDYRQLASKTTVTCTIWLVGSALCDAILAATMVTLLMKSDTKLSATHAVISRLVKWIIGTGALTAFAATADLALFLIFSKTSLHRGISVILSKVYSISLLFVQNQRAVIKRRFGEAQSLPLSTLSFRVPGNGTHGDSTSGDTVEGEIVRMQDMRTRVPSVGEVTEVSDVREVQPPKKSHDFDAQP